MPFSEPVPTNQWTMTVNWDDFDAYHGTMEIQILGFAVPDRTGNEAFQEFLDGVSTLLTNMNLGAPLSIVGHTGTTQYVEVTPPEDPPEE